MQQGWVKGRCETWCGPMMALKKMTSLVLHDPDNTGYQSNLQLPFACFLYFVSALLSGVCLSVFHFSYWWAPLLPWQSEDANAAVQPFCGKTEALIHKADQAVPFQNVSCQTELHGLWITWTKTLTMIPLWIWSDNKQCQVRELCKNQGVK